MEMKVSIVINKPDEKQYHNSDYRYLCTVRPDHPFVHVDNAIAVIHKNFDDEIETNLYGDIFIRNDFPKDNDFNVIKKITEILFKAPVTCLLLQLSDDPESGEHEELSDRHLEELKRAFGAIEIRTLRIGGDEPSIDIEGYECSFVAFTSDYDKLAFKIHHRYCRAILVPNDEECWRIKFGVDYDGIKQDHILRNKNAIGFGQVSPSNSNRCWNARELSSALIGKIPMDDLRRALS